MRSETQIITLINSISENDNRIRAVIINGSRTNSKIEKDEFQDFDIIFLVEELESFRNAPRWIDIFGERIILQMPNSLQIDEVVSETNENNITYLMLFKDFNRIDLKLIEVKNRNDYQDSLNKVLLDKDNLFQQTLKPNDRDYWVKKPTQKEFSDCCNEFWWVITYVIKGLARNEPLYAKEMFENPVRKMLMKMLAWYVGAEIGFTVNVGKSNRFLKKYVNSTIWTRILNTYPNAEKISIWNSLIEMTNLFHKISLEVANKIDLNYNTKEAQNVKTYIKDMKIKVFITTS